jgi:hypothetical protein
MISVSSQHIRTWLIDDSVDPLRTEVLTQRGFMSFGDTRDPNRDPREPSSTAMTLKMSGESWTLICEAVDR